MLALLIQGENMMRELREDLKKNPTAPKHDDQLRRDHYNSRAKLRAFLEVGIIYANKANLIFI